MVADFRVFVHIKWKCCYSWRSQHKIIKAHCAWIYLMKMKKEDGLWLKNKYKHPPTHAASCQTSKYNHHHVRVHWWTFILHCLHFQQAYGCITKQTSTLSAHILHKWPIVFVICFTWRVKPMFLQENAHISVGGHRYKFIQWHLFSSYR